MLIGYDGSKLSWHNKTGTENYATILFHELIALDHNNNYRAYLRHQDPDLKSTPHLESKVISAARLWTQFGLATEVWRHQPDLLFIPAHTMPIIHRPSLKTVVTIHDLGYEYLPQYHQFPGRLYLNKTTEYAAAHASHLIAVSEFTKKDLITKLKVPADKITVIYEGVDAKQMARPSQTVIDKIRLNYHLTQPYVLFVGTVQPRKNLIKLMEALALSECKELELVIAGGKGWLSDEIYATPKRLGLENRIKFLGYIPDSDKPALYAGARMAALVSLFEGFGLPLLEAMAAGTPVIAANTTSLPEVVGPAGLLVDPNNVTAIAKAIDALTTDQELRQKFINLGFQQVKKFTWQSTAQQTLALFEKVMAS